MLDVHATRVPMELESRLSAFLSNSSAATVQERHSQVLFARLPIVEAKEHLLKMPHSVCATLPTSAVQEETTAIWMLVRQEQSLESHLAFLAAAHPIT
jgi:hypothetical protein